MRVSRLLIYLLLNIGKGYKMSLKNKLAVILVVIGVGLASSELLIKNKETNRLNDGHLDPKNHLISPNLIADNIEYEKQYEVLAMLVVADEMCSSCINEIVEYADAVSDYAGSSLNGFNTLLHAFVVGDDSTDYRRIEYLIKFPFQSSLLKKGSPLARKLESWKQDISGINQIVLIDLHHNEVVGRIGIFTVSTTPVFKKNLVQQAFYELEKNNNTK